METRWQFKRMWIDGLKIYDKKIGINWIWQLMDCAITKAPLGAKSTGLNSTDRSKSGTKHSLLVDGQGIPLGITIHGANRHDMKMTRATLHSIVIHRPLPSSSLKLQQQHICLDKDYDYPEVYELKNMIMPCIFAREEKNTIMVTKRRKGYRNTEQEDV